MRVVQDALEERRKASFVRAIFCVQALGRRAASCSDTLRQLAIDHPEYNRPVLAALRAIGPEGAEALWGILQASGELTGAWVGTYRSLGVPLPGSIENRLRPLPPADAPGLRAWSLSEREYFDLLLDPRSLDRELFVELHPWLPGNPMTIHRTLRAYQRAGIWFREVGIASLLVAESLLEQSRERYLFWREFLQPVIAWSLKQFPPNDSLVVLRLSSHQQTARPAHYAALLRPLLQAGWDAKLFLSTIPRAAKVDPSTVTMRLERLEDILVELGPEAREALEELEQSDLAVDRELARRCRSRIFSVGLELRELLSQGRPG